VTDSRAPGRWPLLGLVCSAVPLLAACSGTPAPAAPDAPAPVSAAPAASASATPPSTPALPRTGPPAAKPPSRATTAAPAVQGSCGTITAASGLTLHVLASRAGGVGCAEAGRVVAEFHRKIAGKQARASEQPVGDTVDGWACVSGPPASQGGTTCSKGDQDILAAVVPAE
jgi:hypothetical protein